MGFARSLAMGLILFLLNLNVSEAREFNVGGKENLWRIPTTPTEFNDWAQTERFRIGDSLVFKYDTEKDLVLQVSEEDYKKCNTSNPMKEYHDGNTKIKLDEAGPFFFISGAKGHCDKGERLEVKVLSQKHGSIGGPSSSPVVVLSSPVSAPVDASKSGDVELSVEVIGVVGTFILMAML